MGTANEHTSIYIRLADRERISLLGERERRGIKDQLTVILDEACQRRGLDPETLEPAAKAIAAAS